jgi:hypothetical protein
MSDFQTIADRVEIEALRGEWANLGGAHLEGGEPLRRPPGGGDPRRRPPGGGARLGRHLVAERLRLEGH